MPRATGLFSGRILNRPRQMNDFLPGTGTGSTREPKHQSPMDWLHQTAWLLVFNIQARSVSECLQTHSRVHPAHSRASQEMPRPRPLALAVDQISRKFLRCQSSAEQAATVLRAPPEHLPGCR